MNQDSLWRCLRSCLDLIGCCTCLAVLKCIVIPSIYCMIRVFLECWVPRQTYLMCIRAFFFVPLAFRCRKTVSHPGQETAQPTAMSKTQKQQFIQRGCLRSVLPNSPNGHIYRQRRTNNCTLQITTPWMSPIGTAPNFFESKDIHLLSPSNHTCPAGIIVEFGRKESTWIQSPSYFVSIKQDFVKYRLMLSVLVQLFFYI